MAPARARWRTSADHSCSEDPIPENTSHRSSISRMLRLGGFTTGPRMMLLSNPTAPCQVRPAFFTLPRASISPAAAPPGAPACGLPAGGSADPGGGREGHAGPLARFAARPPTSPLSRRSAGPTTAPATAPSTKVSEYAIQRFSHRSAEIEPLSGTTSFRRHAETGSTLRITMHDTNASGPEGGAFAFSGNRRSRDMSRDVRTIIAGMALSLFLTGLAGCESRQPATRAGAALDRAGTRTGQAVGHAASATGRALDRTGNYIRDKVQ